MRHVLITGGTRGIGLACCKKFAAEGDLVTALYSSDEEAARHAKKLLPAVEFLRADVSDGDAIKRVFDVLPKLDVLVNNAGIQLIKQVQDTSLSEWERVMAVNAGGAFLCSKYAVKKLLDGGGGTIINVSSIWGEIGGSCESVYSASKGAIIAFTKALAKELAPSLITVNCVSPGAIETDMNAHLSEEEERGLKEEIPMGRFGLPEEVSELIYFLSTQRYITGQDIAINGGWNC